MKAALFPIVACLLFISLINARAEGNLWSGRIDFSEDANSYIVRVQARNASSLEVRLVGNTLSIASGDLSSGARHIEQHQPHTQDLPRPLALLHGIHQQDAPQPLALLPPVDSKVAEKNAWDHV
jgi:hypothetical protein